MCLAVQICQGAAERARNVVAAQARHAYNNTLAVHSADRHVILALDHPEVVGLRHDSALLPEQAQIIVDIQFWVRQPALVELPAELSALTQLSLLAVSTATVSSVVCWLRGLRKLHLHQPRVKADDLRQLGRLSGLEELRISHARDSAASLVAAIRNMAAPASLSYRTCHSHTGLVTLILDLPLSYWTTTT